MELHLLENTIAKYKVKYLQNGKINTEIIYSDNKESIKDDLPLGIDVVSISNSYSLKTDFQLFSQKQSSIELFSQLSLMLNSNLTLSQSIELMLKSKQDDITTKILNLIDDAIKTSKPIDTVLHPYQKYLGTTSILFLKLGIENGNIKESINSLVELLTQDKENREKFYDMMRYPIVLICSLFIAIVLILLYVLPSFEYIFTMLDGNLPLPTQILLSISDIFNNYFLYIVLGFSIFGFIIYKLYIKYKLNFDKILISNIPILSSVIRNYLFFRLFLSISIIVKSKYQFQVAINHSKNIVDNKYIQTVMNTILLDIKGGSSIAQAFEKSDIFDDLTIRLLYIAQETNNYTQVLQDISLYYKTSFDNSIKKLSSILEPTMILLISLLVLWLVLAVMLPIWNISSIIS